MGQGKVHLTGIIRLTNVLIAGKHIVVCGYGNVGRGVAARARGLGAIVTVVEVDPLKATRSLHGWLQRKKN